MDATKTQRLANPNWKPCAVSARAVVAAVSALTGIERPVVVRARTARTTFCGAKTTELPVVGRSGTKERVRAMGPDFGGGEVR